MSTVSSILNVTALTRPPAMLVHETSREVEVNVELIDLTRTEFDLLGIFKKVVGSLACRSTSLGAIRTSRRPDR